MYLGVWARNDPRARVSTCSASTSTPTTPLHVPPNCQTRVWEIALKVGLGKHQLEFPLARLEAAIVEAGFQCLDITVRHALALERVKTSHADPFDRLLLAQCQVETFRLITTDERLTQLPVAIAC